jgi:Pyocin activator protein PrtN
VKTIFFLMAQYDARPVIPLEWVQRDFFNHLDVKKLAAKCTSGEIMLPLVRTDPKSQKSDSRSRRLLGSLSAGSAQGTRSTTLDVKNQHTIEISKFRCFSLAIRKHP